MKKILSYILIGCIVIGIYCGGTKVNANEKSSIEKVDIILSEEEKLIDVEMAIHEMDEDIQVTSCPEIGMLNLTIPDDVNTYDVLKRIESFDQIKACGVLGEIVQERLDLGATSYMEDVEQNCLSSLFMNRNSNESIYEQLAWHVDAVTNNKESLEVSKGSGCKIALVDSGIDINHPFLNNCIDYENSKSFVSGESNINDTNGHGTMVAGILHQVAPEALIVPYKVIGDSSGESQWTIEAIVEAVNDEVDVINLSLGTYKCINEQSEKLTIEAFEEAIDYALENDVMVVASVGNNGDNLDELFANEGILHLPSEIEGVNAVSSSHGTSLASYSNYGLNTQFCAPGGELVYVDGYVDIGQWIYCIFPTSMDNGLASIGVPQGYTFSYGTSLATPSVSAGAADLKSYYLSKHPDEIFTIEEVYTNLKNGSVDLGTPGHDIYFGHGRINIGNSLEEIY